MATKNKIVNKDILSFWLLVILILSLVLRVKPLCENKYSILDVPS